MFGIIMHMIPFLAKRLIEIQSEEASFLVSQYDGTAITSENLASFSSERQFLLLNVGGKQEWHPRAWIGYGSRTIPDSFGTPLGRNHESPVSKNQM